MIYAGPDFADKLRFSVEDFARGAVEYSGRSRFMSARVDELPAKDVLAACMDAERIYRIWVRPYDGGTIVNRAFVRAYMTEVKRRVGIELRWFAAIHLKPTVAFAEHRHFHVIMRNVDLDRSFKRTAAKIASDLLTKRLGLMTDAEVERMRSVSEANEPPIRIQRFMKNWTLLPE